MSFGIAALLALSLTQADLEWRTVEPRLTPQYRACMRSGDAARGADLAMWDCVTAEVTRQDRQLNQVYQRAMRRLGAPQRDRLRTLQRSWIEFRDRDCSRRSDEAGGGTYSTLHYGECILNRTVQRTSWLENYR